LGQSEERVVDDGVDDHGATVVRLLTGLYMYASFRTMSKRTSLGAILLGVLVLAVGCGGSEEGAPKVTLADTACTYSGTQTHEPGVFDIEAENTTSHFAAFAVYELAPGFSIKEVRGFFHRLIVAHDRGETNVEPPRPADFRRDEAWSHADPRATTLLPVNASAGRFVIVCMENTTADNRVSSEGVYPFAAAIYVPTQLEIR
jgi:hypothetical protein